MMTFGWTTIRAAARIAAGALAAVALAASPAASVAETAPAQGAGGGGAAEVAIVPEPLQVERREGAFRLTRATRILTPPGDEAAEQAAEFLRETLARSTGLPLAAARHDGPGEGPGDLLDGTILLTTRGADATLSDEGYTLDVSPASVVVRSGGAAGLFYGVQSFLQLLPPQAYGQERAPAGTDWVAPSVSIRDQPRFEWRGGMLDVSRHLFEKRDILRLLDAMAMHKQNVFHWHLVDDHGWRIEIKRYPKLTEVGAWRDGIGFGLDPKLSDRYDDRGRYGGFYTQDDVREVVAYAAARHITVVPEIEMPGHSSAALKAYPQFGCKDDRIEAPTVGGVFPGVYCAGNDETFEFLENVLDEVIPLFPGAYVHVGGDEVPKAGWKACERCQARIKNEGLKDEHELQSYFIRRIERFLNGRGKRLIGWDEILEGGLAPDATVMSWRGVAGGIAAARAGHDAVMSPTSHCYFDYAQSRTGEAPQVGVYLPLEKVYAYEPVPPELTAEQAVHIKGVQGNLWTEYVPNFAHAAFQLYPRMSAIAEIGWSDPEGRDFADFERRVVRNERRLDAMGLNYRPRPPVGIERAIDIDYDLKQLTLLPPADGLDVRYTLDGTDPSRSSPQYDGPMPVPGDGLALVRARFFRPGTLASYYVQQMLLDGVPVEIDSSLAAHEDHALARAFDGSDDTFFWSNHAVKADDHVTLTFAEPRRLRSVRVVTGHPAGRDALARGTIEVSRGDGRFEAVADFRDGEAEARLDDRPVGAVRVRVAEPSAEWLVIREIVLQ